MVCFTSCASAAKGTGGAKARQMSQNEVVLPLAAKHVGRGEAWAQKNKPFDRSNLQHEEKPSSFDTADNFKSRQSRSDPALERDWTCYWGRTPVALSLLNGTTETMCKKRGIGCTTNPWRFPFLEVSSLFYSCFSGFSVPCDGIIDYWTGEHALGDHGCYIWPSVAGWGTIFGGMHCIFLPKGRQTFHITKRSQKHAWGTWVVCPCPLHTL